jgi:hypothetical protein
LAKHQQRVLVEAYLAHHSEYRHRAADREARRDMLLGLKLGSVDILTKPNQNADVMQKAKK